MESMAAAIHAGADAVYMGGSRFGARAYADNPEEDRFLRAIDYAHLHRRRIYMTTNTLVKEEETESFLDFLEPYYRHGVDAVIVQDLGVFALIRENFPDLPVHVSTQMTITGHRSARMMKRMGATRVVTARELSLKELAQIRGEVDIEIESFVHGALCYCYSGQCLMSSLIGGRSGNRGRCAQPCRLPYRVLAEKDMYLLNLKDLCTLDILPDILEAGVYSLKIEGRMKSPRYTAGVVHIYRKYVDRYLEQGRDGYRVEPEDKQTLLKLFDRGGFTEGYYRKQNGRDMVALGKKPGFRETDSALFDFLDREYVNKKLQEPVLGTLTVHEEEPLQLHLEGGRKQVHISGNMVQTAQNQPVTEERLRRQMGKTGESPFYFERLRVDISGNCFVPVQELNELRRKGLAWLEEEILKPYRRPAEKTHFSNESNEPKSGWKFGPEGGSSRKTDSIQRNRLRLHASLEEPEGLLTVASHGDVEEVYVDSCGFSAESWEETVDLCHKKQKKCALILPHIFREKAEQYFLRHLRQLERAGFDELILRSLDEVDFVKELGIGIPVVWDANLYAMNRQACRLMEEMGASRITLPLELNEKELFKLGCGGKELIAYGHLPVMVSAQCIRKTTEGCHSSPGVIFMRDRTGKSFPVKNHCRFCYNTIYNSTVLSLLGLKNPVERLGPEVLRLSFTIEPPRQIQSVLRAYGDHFLRGQDVAPPFNEYTRGHFRRGVE